LAGKSSERFFDAIEEQEGGEAELLRISRARENRNLEKEKAPYIQRQALESPWQEAEVGIA
jgi:hypothetical protein